MPDSDDPAVAEIRIAFLALRRQIFAPWSFSGLPALRIPSPSLLRSCACLPLSCSSRSSGSPRSGSYADPPPRKVASGQTLRDQWSKARTAVGTQRGWRVPARPERTSCGGRWLDLPPPSNPKTVQHSPHRERTRRRNWRTAPPFPSTDRTGTWSATAQIRIARHTAAGELPPSRPPYENPSPRPLRGDRHRQGTRPPAEVIGGRCCWLRCRLFVQAARFGSESMCRLRAHTWSLRRFRASCCVQPSSCNLRGFP